MAPVQRKPRPTAGPRGAIGSPVDRPRRRRARDAKTSGAPTEAEALRGLVNSVTDRAMILLDATGHVRLWSTGAELLMGYPRDEVIGRHIEMLFDPAEPSGAQRSLDLASSANGSLETDVSLVRNGGERFLAHIKVGAFHDTNASAHWFSLVLRPAGTDSHSRRGSARIGEGSRDDFLALVGHELRAPVASIQLLAKAVWHDLDSTETASLTRRVARLVTLRAEVDRLATLVDHVLGFAQLTFGVPTLRREEVDLVDVVRTAVSRSSADSAAGTHSDVRVSAAGPVIGVWDQLWLEQVVVNLISNALKYGLGHPIDVTVDGDDSIGRVRVHDRGIGIALEERMHIFERYARGTAAQSHPGLGIGLWVVRTVIEAMGGRVAVEGPAGGGTLFTVELPRGYGGDRPFRV